MKRTYLLPAAFVLLGVFMLQTAFAQRRPLYPAPKLTPRVAAIRAARTPWQPVRPAAGQLPAAVDNSQTAFFPPVIDQQGGSCAQASAIGYVFTYEMNRLLRRSAAEATNRFSYFFAWNFLNDGADEGGFAEEGFFLAQRFGMMTEADFGTALATQFKWASGFEKYLNAQRYLVEHIYTFPATDEAGLAAIRRYLADGGTGAPEGGILSFSTYSGNWLVAPYDGPSLTGYRRLLTRLASEGAHALTIVGYDDTVAYTDAAGQRREGAFIVVNTWGSAMHDRGRFYLPYHFFTDRSTLTFPGQLSEDMTGVSVRTAEPRLLLRVGLDYSSRDDLSLRYGAADGRDATRPATWHDLQIVRNQGGDWPLPGAWNNTGTLTLAIDYTPRLTAPDEMPARFFLDVIRSGRGSRLGSGRLTELSVTDLRTTPARTYTLTATEGELALGNNVFSLPVVPRLTVSASPLRAAAGDGRAYVVRCADGRLVKVQFVSGPDGRRQLRYVPLRIQEAL